jgi:hypothetical protein
LSWIQSNLSGVGVGGSQPSGRSWAIAAPAAATMTTSAAK